jgi:hypothetical protein
MSIKYRDLKIGMHLVMYTKDHSVSYIKGNIYGDHNVRYLMLVKEAGGAKAMVDVALSTMDINGKWSCFRKYTYEYLNWFNVRGPENYEEFITTFNVDAISDEDLFLEML